MDPELKRLLRQLRDLEDAQGISADLLRNHILDRVDALRPDRTRSGMKIDTTRTANDQGMWPDREFAANQEFVRMLESPFVQDTLRQYYGSQGLDIEDVLFQTMGIPGTWSNIAGAVDVNDPSTVNMDVSSFWSERGRPGGVNRPEYTLAHELRHVKQLADRDAVPSEVKNDPWWAERDAIAATAGIASLRDAAPFEGDGWYNGLLPFVQDFYQRKVEDYPGMRPHPGMDPDHVLRAIQAVQDAGFYGAGNQ